MGSWNTIASSRPQIRRRFRCGSRSRSRPAKSALPPAIPPGGSSPISASTDIVFPLPLSPAIPKTSPGSTR
jgi:hypothetical protein